MLFAEFVEKWKDDCRLNAGQSWNNVQDTLLRLHILPILGQMRRDEIRPPDISRVMLASKDKGHSAKTMLHIYTIMFSLFQNAIEFYELLTKNPVKRKFHKPKVPKKKANFLTPEMTVVFLEYVMGTRYAVGVWVQALTGLRVGEMLALKWSDVDLVNDQILVSKTFVRGTKDQGGNRIQAFPKGKEANYVPIPPMLKRFLLRFERKPDAYIMPNQLGDHMCYYVYRRFMRQVCKKLKLEIRTSHGLRHSCTELWVNAGATAEDIRRLLNHKSLDATAGYIHRTDDRLKRISKKIV